MPTPNAIIFNALSDIGVIGVGQSAIAPEDVALGVSKLNRRISQWNTRRAFGSFEYTQVFTLPATPSDLPNGYTIGATADSPKLIVTAGRAPVRIDSAKRVVGTGSSAIETQIKVMDFDEWDRLTIPGLATDLTLAVYL